MAVSQQFNTVTVLMDSSLWLHIDAAGKHALGILLVICLLQKN